MRTDGRRYIRLIDLRFICATRRPLPPGLQTCTYIYNILVEVVVVTAATAAVVVAVMSTVVVVAVVGF